MLGLGNLSDGLLNAAEKVDNLNNALKAKKDAVKEAVSDKINDAKEAVEETKESAATAVKNVARKSLKSTVEQINKNA